MSGCLRFSPHVGRLVGLTHPVVDAHMDDLTTPHDDDDGGKAEAASTVGGSIRVNAASGGAGVGVAAAGGGSGAGAAGTAAEDGAAGGALLKTQQQQQQQSDVRDYGRVTVVLSATERELQASLDFLARTAPVDPSRRIVHNVRKGRKLLAMARWRRALTARRVCLLPRALAHFETAVVRRALAAWKEERIEAVVLQLMAKEMQTKVRMGQG